MMKRISLNLKLNIKKNKYHATYIEALEHSLIECMTHVVDNYFIKTADISLFSPQYEANSIKQTIFKDDTLISRLIYHAHHHAKKIALITETETINYHDLYIHVTQLVCFFSNKNLLSTQPVVVILDRGPCLIATLLALQWLGIAYIPLDIQTPIERLATIVNESKACAIITDIDKHYDNFSVIQLNGYRQTNAVIPQPIHGLIAYVIYTSGSTGKPKGVSISYRALHNFLASMHLYFAKREDDLLLAITTIAFDISALELFLPIWSGSSLYLANQKQHKDPFAIQSILTKYEITLLQATPAMWNMLLQTEWQGKNDLIALCGGESLSYALAEKLIPKVSELWNMYGPTEATIWCALKKIQAHQMITIGKPIPNLQLFILDEQQQLLPPYVKGELFIAGAGLAEGYLNQPVLTQTNFIFHSQLNMRLYRTGDIACVNRDGEFIIFGRKDNQIKLNGYRIELNEIEIQLCSIEPIKQAAVIAAENQLIAYLVVDEPMLDEAIQARLVEFLPEYMLPKRYVFLDALPLSNSGKIDRKALSKESHHTVTANSTPANELEKKLYLAWVFVLKNNLISVVDNFYQCGGHSLLAMQIIARLHEQFNIDLSLHHFFKYPTIRSCATYLANTTNRSVIIPKTNLTHYPLTDTQKRFWLTKTIVP